MMKFWSWSSRACYISSYRKSQGGSSSSVTANNEKDVQGADHHVPSLTRVPWKRCIHQPLVLLLARRGDERCAPFSIWSAILVVEQPNNLLIVRKIRDSPQANPVDRMMRRTTMVAYCLSETSTARGSPVNTPIVKRALILEPSTVCSGFVIMMLDRYGERDHGWWL